MKNLPRIIRILPCLLCLLFAAPQFAEAQFQSLVSRVPHDANVLFLLNVEKAMATPLGQNENWAKRHQDLFNAGLIAVPPNCSQMVSAMKLDLDSMQPEWEMSVLKMNVDVPVSEIATRFRGTVDRIEDRDVAVLPGDHFIVRLNKETYASGRPATRQGVARWMKRTYSATPIQHSEYLIEAQKFAESGAPLIFALDLTDAVSPALIRDRLATSKTLEGTDIDRDAAAEALASIRGVTLGVAVTNLRGGSLKVDFAKDISMLKDLAKPLVLEALERNGASIREFYDWEVAVSENQIRLRGELTQSGTRRILSLLEPPPNIQADLQNPTEGQQDEKKMLYASQVYFSSIATLIDDLRDKKSERKTMGQLTVWFDRYARKIDRLPVLNVDPDLLGYGKYVSDTFRGGATSVTEAAATSRIQQSQVPEQYDTYSWSTPVGVTNNYWRGAQVWGWGGWQAVPNDRRRGQIQSQIRTEQRIKGSLSANTVLQQVDAVTADVRRAMTQKYNAEF